MKCNKTLQLLVFGVAMAGFGNRAHADITELSEDNDLGDLGGESSEVAGMNASGQTCGWAHSYQDTVKHAFFHDGTEMIDLETLGSGVDSWATALNNSGQVAGNSEYDSSSNATHAFLWSEGAGMTDLGTLGGAWSQAIAINSSGDVIGWSTLSGTGTTPKHAFIYTGGEMVDLGTLGGSSAEPTGINDDGVVCGFSTNASNKQHGFIWSGGTMTSIGTLISGGTSKALAISENSVIVGWATVTGGLSRAISYSGSGGLVNLGTLGTGTRSEARGVNAAGDIWGWSATSGLNNLQGFVYSGSTMTGIGTLNGSTSSTIYAMNESGDVVGDSGGEAFLYSGGTLTGLGSVNGGASKALGVNLSGDIIGTSYVSGTSNYRAFLCPGGGTMEDLGTLGDSNSPSLPKFINDDGQISGKSWLSGNGQHHGFLWTPTP